MVPNIFKYATKELSQDALICWLVACAKEETDGRLRECGRKFVRALMQSGDEPGHHHTHVRPKGPQTGVCLTPWNMSRYEGEPHDYR